MFRAQLDYNIEARRKYDKNACDDDKDSDDSDSDSDEDEEVEEEETSESLSAYELQRLETIKKNQEMLAALGLQEAADAVKTKPKSSSKAKNPSKKKKKKKAVKKSRRLLGKPAPAITKPPKPSVPRIPRKPKTEDSCCTIQYDSFPASVKSQYPLMYSNSKSGLFYVHYGQRSWQAQLYVNVGSEKKLVHIGMFSDRLTAGLSIAITLKLFKDGTKLDEFIGDAVRAKLEELYSNTVSNTTVTTVTSE